MDLAPNKNTPKRNGQQMSDFVITTEGAIDMKEQLGWGFHRPVSASFGGCHFSTV
jgi:hypothetical protein